MLKKTIEYEDFNGQKRTGDFYFNLSQAEVMQMEMSTAGGLVEKINRLVASQNGEEIVRIFKDIILSAYGEKSPDGVRFIKSPEISAAFEQTDAFNVLFVELATDGDKAAAFVNAIIPQPKA